MTAAFALISLLDWWHQGRAWRWTIGMAAVFLAVTLFRPGALKPLNRLWLKFGIQGGKPHRDGFGVLRHVLPTGLVMRALGKDLLRLKRQPSVRTGAAP
jgi:hypothetical protein